MLRLVAYRGECRGLDEAISAFLNSVRRSWSELLPRVSAEWVSWWLTAGGSDCSPLIALEGRVVQGVVNVCLGTSTAETILYIRGGDVYVAAALLSGVYWWLRGRGYSGPVLVYCGPLHGGACSVAAGLTGGVSEWVTTLMLAERGGGRGATRGGVVLEEVDVREEGVLGELLDVYNRAFARYEWFTPLSLEEFAEWVRTARPVLLVVRVEGRVAGFAAYTRREAVGGERVVYIHDVAVDPVFQGRGLGRLLVSYILSSGGAARVVVTAVHGLEGFYARMGFREHLQLGAVKCLVDGLPDDAVSVEPVC